MNLFHRAMIGAAWGVAIAIVVGAVFGGVAQIGPCGGGLDGRSAIGRFTQCAAFGAMVVGPILSVPGAILGLIFGALGATLDNLQKDPVAGKPPASGTALPESVFEKCPHCTGHRYACDCENPNCGTCHVKMSYTGSDDAGAYYECPKCGAEGAP